MNKSFSQELQMLRSLAISIVGTDSEGAYRPEYVRRILKNARKKPTEEFVSGQQFLDEVESAQ